MRFFNLPAKSFLCASLTFLALILALPAQSQTLANPRKSRHLENFGEANWPILQTKLRNAKQQTTHLMQFGDSHTAADIFSGQLRKRWQKQFGDGGIGLLPPGAFSGIRQDTVKIRSSKYWRLLSTRNLDANNFSPTGYYAVPMNEDAFIEITPRSESSEDADLSGLNTQHEYQIALLYQAERESRLLLDDGRSAFLNSSDGAWTLSEALANASLPLALRIRAPSEFLLGGIYLTKPKAGGVIYSALGVNGATLMDWDKWQENWPQTLQTLAPDMLILAYGTNEATNPTLDIEEYRQLLTRKIRAIREALPKAVILLIGAPDSLRALRKPVETRDRKSGKISKKRPTFDCRAQRPPNLANIIDIQRDVARQEKTLYWDWQAYMGGVCSMYQWSQRGLARNDLVHFLTEGYRQSADALYQDLQILGGFR